MKGAMTDVWRYRAPPVEVLHALSAKLSRGRTTFFNCSLLESATVGVNFFRVLHNDVALWALLKELKMSCTIGDAIKIGI
jgi:hypothetical protein